MAQPSHLSVIASRATAVALVEPWASQGHLSVGLRMCLLRLGKQLSRHKRATSERVNDKGVVRDVTMLNLPDQFDQR